MKRALLQSRERLGMASDEEIPDDLLVAEVAGLAHPQAVSGRDAVVPAPRLDLADRWFSARLRREADTEELRIALARRIAPLPDEGFSGMRRVGVTRERVEQAVRYFAKRDKPSA